MSEPRKKRWAVFRLKEDGSLDIALGLVKNETYEGALVACEEFFLKDICPFGFSLEKPAKNFMVRRKLSNVQKN